MAYLSASQIADISEKVKKGKDLNNKMKLLRAKNQISLKIKYLKTAMVRKRKTCYRLNINIYFK